MADTYTYQPNYNRSNRFGTYLNQYGATSGRVPSARVLDEIIQSELDAASNNMYRNKTLQLQKEAQAEQIRQFGVSQQNAVETASANRTAGLVGTGMNLLGTYGLYRALRPSPTSVPTQTGTGLANGGTYTIGDWQNSPSNHYSPTTRGYDAWNNYIQGTGPTAQATEQYTSQAAADYATQAAAQDAGINVSGTTTLGTTGTQTGVNVAGTAGLTESAIPAASTELAGAGAGEAAAYELGGSGASGAGAAGGAGAGVETAGAASIGSYLTPVGYVAAALGAKKQWGGEGIPWEEKTTFQKATTAPGTSGALLPLTIGTKVFGDESVFGKAYKEMARIEEKVMSPIQQVFDFFGGLF